MIKSLSYDQSEILNNILTLNCIDYFCADISYGNGGFYKNVPEPKIKIDIDPTRENCVHACSTNTGIDNESINSVVFDPPFLTYVKSARNHNSIMAKRFGGYWLYTELEEHYKNTIKEAARILRKKGVMVFKCQDVIHNHKMHPTHINIVKWSDGVFRLKDLFILCAKNRMPMPEKYGEKRRIQKHARVHHSYFLVLEKL